MPALGIGLGIPFAQAVAAGGGGPTTLLKDNFVGTNGTALTAHTMDVGGGWTQYGPHDWNIQSNLAVIGASGMVGDQNVDAADSGSATVTVTANVTMPASAASADSGIVCRLADNNNYWLMTLGGGGNLVILYEKAASVFTNRASGAFTWVNNTTYAVKLVASGTTLTCSVGGVQICQYASAASGLTATRCGLRENVGGTGATTFGNFLVTNP